MQNGENEARVWLITGATSGFGLALTEAAVASGDVVVGAARSAGGLDAVLAAHPELVAWEAVSRDTAIDDAAAN